MKCEKIKGIVWVGIPTNNSTETSKVFCDRIDFFENHLMLYNGDNLVFKVWLKDIKPTIKENIESCGLIVCLRDTTSLL